MEVSDVIAGFAHFGAEIGQLGLQLLHADHICLLISEPCQEAFYAGGADSVEIGSDDA